MAWTLGRAPLLSSERHLPQSGRVQILRPCPGHGSSDLMAKEAAACPRRAGEQARPDPERMLTKFNPRSGATTSMGPLLLRSFSRGRVGMKQSVRRNRRAGSKRAGRRAVGERPNRQRRPITAHQPPTAPRSSNFWASSQLSLAAGVTSLGRFRRGIGDWGPSKTAGDLAGMLDQHSRLPAPFHAAFFFRLIPKAPNICFNTWPVCQGTMEAAGASGKAGGYCLVSEASRATALQELSSTSTAPCG